MDTLIFVVNVIDFAYKKPIVKVAYAGIDMEKAHSFYRECVACSDRTQVNLELVQGENVKRLETHHYVASYDGKTLVLRV